MLLLTQSAAIHVADIFPVPVAKAPRELEVHEKPDQAIPPVSAPVSEAIASPADQGVHATHGPPCT